MSTRNFSKSLKVSLKENSSAYGYSIAITGSYAVLTALQKSPSLSALFAAAAGGVCAFVTIEVATLLIFRNVSGGKTERTRLIARMMNIVSVGSSMGAAAFCGVLLSGAAAWFTGTFSATCLFVLFDAIELSIVKDGAENRKSAA